MCLTQGHSPSREKETDESRRDVKTRKSRENQRQNTEREGTMQNKPEKQIESEGGERKKALPRCKCFIGLL